MGDDNYNYSNDPIGNREQSTVYSGQSTVTNTYVANQLNQYTAITGGNSASPIHDADGNLTWDGQKWSHGWDGENRLISSAPDYWGTTNGATRIDYTYDYMNRRVSKTISIMAGRYVSYPPSYDDLQGAWSALETRRFIWDGWNIASEIIIDQTTFTTNINYYTLGLDLSGTLQGAGGVGGLLAETKTTSSSTNTYYALGDANGNVTEYIDSTGTVKAHYEYSAFGEITFHSFSMADDFTHRFSTKYFDPETGLYYYGYRYYDPILGIWLSRDPVEEWGGLNFYAFVENDGINKFDILGQFNLPNSWLVRYADIVNQTQYSKIWVLLLAEVRGRFTKGGDPWLPSFLALYFYGDGSKTLILTKNDVSKIKETNHSLWFYSEEFKSHSEKKAAFMGHKVINETQSNRRFEVITQGGGTGNDTLGHFDVYYKGEVKNCTFKGHYKIKDDFSFHWDRNGGRSLHGEALVRLFSLYFHGVKFNVESEWISKTEKWGRDL
ncbi:MAG: RHS repeat-associated core domain-containing protein [Kiritimatiellia bacterium]